MGTEGKTAAEPFLPERLYFRRKNRTIVTCSLRFLTKTCFLGTENSAGTICRGERDYPI